MVTEHPTGGFSGEPHALSPQRSPLPQPLGHSATGLCKASLDALCVLLTPHTRVCPAVSMLEPCPPASVSCPRSSRVFLCSDKSVDLFHSLFLQRQGS